MLKMEIISLICSKHFTYKVLLFINPTKPKWFSETLYCITYLNNMTIYFNYWKTSFTWCHTTMTLLKQTPLHYRSLVANSPKWWNNINTSWFLVKLEHTKNTCWLIFNYRLTIWTRCCKQLTECTIFYIEVKKYFQQCVAKHMKSTL